MVSSMQFREFVRDDLVYCQFIRRPTILREFASVAPGIELWESVDSTSPTAFGELLKTLRVYVAVNDDYVCGFCAVRIYNAGIADIVLLYVKSDMREHDLASALLRFSEVSLVTGPAPIKVFTATVASQNEDSWLAEGYSVVGRATGGMLGSGSPAIRVRKFTELEHD